MLPPIKTLLEDFDTELLKEIQTDMDSLKIDLMPEMPVVTLPPIPYKLLPQGAKDDDFIDKLTEIKEDRSRTVIIGLLEDEEEERKVNTQKFTRFTHYMYRMKTTSNKLITNIL